MKNYIQPGDTLTVPAPATIASGEGVIIGELFGVAAGDAESGADFDFVTRGVFSLPKDSADVIAVGARVGWDAGNKRVTTDAPDAWIGHATEARGNGATEIPVRLAPAIDVTINVTESA